MQGKCPWIFGIPTEAVHSGTPASRPACSTTLTSSEVSYDLLFWYWIAINGQNYGSIEQLLVGVGFILSEGKIADLLQIGLLARQFWRFFFFVRWLAFLGRTAFLVLYLWLWKCVLIMRMRVSAFAFLEIALAVAASKLMDELQIFILLALLFDLAHLLLLHTINNLKFLTLLYPLLILVSLLHQFLHKVIDVLIDHLQFSELGVLPRSFVLMQIPYETLSLHLRLDIIGDLHSTFEVVGLRHCPCCLFLPLGQILKLLVDSAQFSLKLPLLALLQLTDLGDLALIIIDLRLENTVFRLSLQPLSQFACLLTLSPHAFALPALGTLHPGTDLFCLLVFHLLQH
jgi:hypothetical protein